ncbi:nuclease-related domain-containing protein [Deinococcus hopiensis]|uniref:DnaJ-class molecular chaperone with C-terminal Zn finger domain n=1 Tax=Deinococcus hopiensis KR-140 TaxID=695939 RepID=A0A1W1ULZ7_9DEIO|nr:nuclease-related domain-containing protein [Deinococcus hopiensis]SMB82107.1 DnaJ-class molecular chaperone with C-terminal Zn finger domain [Deinococcus hopiensis KR-140]
MIVKDSLPQPTSDRFQRAGDEAERQMAHYLKRAFGENQSVHVFNNLRLEHDGEVAQIDHLIFHRAGFVIVESKSVTSSVRINERDEWARQWNGRWSGMPSPVLQARRQGDLLRALLQAHKAELRNKILFGLKQGEFKLFIIDAVVAISDSGVVQASGKLSDVKKADQIPDRIKELIAEHGRAASLLSTETRADDMGFNLSPEEFTRVSAFLQAKHKEREQFPAERRDVASPPPAPSLNVPTGPSQASGPAAQTFTCNKCRSADLEIKFGHNYYFKCRSCGGSTPIKLTCPTCSAQARTRKSGASFYRECATCATSAEYFTNPGPRPTN